MMTDSLSPQAVLAALPELPELTLEAANVLFGATWQASHVRLVALRPDAGAAPALLLAFALANNPAAETAPETWLPNTIFRVATKDELIGQVGQALDDLAEAPERPNETLAAALARLGPDAARDIYAIEPDLDRPPPREPYEYGPTEQLFWTSGGWFHYLEVHHES